MKNSLTETKLTQELKEQLSRDSYSELKYDELDEILTREGYEPENLTSHNDACYCLGVYYNSQQYLNVYIPNCKEVNDEEDFDTYAVQCGETFDYLFTSKSSKEVVDFINSLKEMIYV